MPVQKSKKSGEVIDFTGVESSSRWPEGDYVVKVSESSWGESSTGNKQIINKYEALKGELKGSTTTDWLTITPKALWRLKKMMEAAGIPVASGKMRVRTEDIEGTKLGITIVHEEYDGKKKAKVSDYWPLAEAEPAKDEFADEEEADDDIDLDDDEEDDL